MDKVFIFQRKEADSKYRLYGKTTVLEATHTVRDGGFAGIELLENALFARVARSLFLGRHFPMNLIGYFWDKEDKNIRRYFSMVFHISIYHGNIAVRLNKKQFI